MNTENKKRLLKPKSPRRTYARAEAFRICAEQLKQLVGYDPQKVVRALSICYFG